MMRMYRSTEIIVNAYSMHDVISKTDGLRKNAEFCPWFDHAKMVLSRPLLLFEQDYVTPASPQNELLPSVSHRA